MNSEQKPIVHTVPNALILYTSSDSELHKPQDQLCKTINIVICDDRGCCLEGLTPVVSGPRGQPPRFHKLDLGFPGIPIELDYRAPNSALLL